MDKKYIIRNCPAFCHNFCGDDRKDMFCDEVADCLIKQVVKKCKRSLEVSYCPIETEILQLFEIEEVKDDVISI